MREKGIYLIRDHDTQKAYVGSTIDVEKRFIAHHNTLKAGSHANKHLQKAFDENHKADIVFIPLNADVNVLDVEQCILDEFYDQGVLYNIAKNARAPNMGMSDSEETRLKKSLAKKGIPQSPDLIEKRAEANRGKKRSPETCERIGLAKKGNTFWLGKNHSQETREKMSESKKKPVIVEGKEFPSISAAASHYGLSITSTQKRIVSDRPNWADWQYVKNKE